MLKKLLCLFIVFTLFFELQLIVKADENPFEQIVVLTDEEDQNDGSYDAYLKEHAGYPFYESELMIPAASFKSAEGAEIKLLDILAGKSNVAEWRNEKGSIECEVNIPREGLYSIAMEYYPLEGSSGNIELQVSINGGIPFDEARTLVFPRSWKDEGDIKQDSNGNQIKPRQIEEPVWMIQDFRDSEGFYSQPFQFYFTEGINKIRITSIREPLAIGGLKLYQQKPLPAYGELAKTYEQQGYKLVKGELIKIPAEKNWLKSDPVLYPIGERDDPGLEPYHYSRIRLNAIGGYNWRYPGQFITWKFEVLEDGLYRIGVKFRQDYLRGFYTSRKIYIDGKVPFKEMNNVQFRFTENWSMKLLGDNDPYLFYLSKGTHELKMEAVLGDISESLGTLQKCVFRMNELYRKIIMITSTRPDPFRDYYLEKEIPNLLTELKDLERILMDEAGRFEKISGKKGSEAAILERIAVQLKSMYDKPDTISTRLDNYKSNISSLSAWVLGVKEQPLVLDYIFLAPEDAKLPKPVASLFAKIISSIQSFFASFYEDYNSIGNTYSGKQAITVWAGWGRDQAQIIKNLVDDEFTPKTGIPVNVKLVQASLIEAILAGTGPDIGLNIARGQPVNLAVRGALLDLSEFKDFDKVTKRFGSTALLPYEYNKKYFALPNTQEFYMMFYRKDILEELGIKAPETMEEFYRIVPMIQRNNMDVGIPYVGVNATNVIDTGMGARNAFPPLLFQRGGEFYKENHSETAFDTTQAVDAFKEWTSFYIKYDFPLTYDFYNRFRTGEMPLAIQSYTVYNIISAAAPELRNLWEMKPIPGIRMDNGEINRSQGASGSAAVILKNSKHKDASWEFLKWWTSDDIQLKFGRELEALMGASARYPTANMEAFKKLPWKKSELHDLLEQWEHIKEIPEVPGSYYTARSLDNAFADVIFNGENSRDALFVWNDQINKELKRKREEFGLDRQEVDK